MPKHKKNLTVDIVKEEVLRRFGQKYRYDETQLNSLSSYIDAHFHQSISVTIMNIKNKSETFEKGITNLFNFLDRDISKEISKGFPPYSGTAAARRGCPSSNYFITRMYGRSNAPVTVQDESFPLGYSRGTFPLLVFDAAKLRNGEIPYHSAWDSSKPTICIMAIQPNRHAVVFFVQRKDDGTLNMFSADQSLDPDNPGLIPVDGNQELIDALKKTGNTAVSTFMPRTTYGTMYPDEFDPLQRGAVNVNGEEYYHFGHPMQVSCPADVLAAPQLSPMFELYIIIKHKSPSQKVHGMDDKELVEYINKQNDTYSKKEYTLRKMQQKTLTPGNLKQFAEEGIQTLSSLSRLDVVAVGASDPDRLNERLKKIIYRKSTTWVDLGPEFLHGLQCQFDPKTTLYCHVPAACPRNHWLLNINWDDTSILLEGGKRIDRIGIDSCHGVAAFMFSGDHGVRVVLSPASICQPDRLPGHREYPGITGTLGNNSLARLVSECRRQLTSEVSGKRCNQRLNEEKIYEEMTGGPGVWNAIESGNGKENFFITNPDFIEKAQPGSSLQPTGAGRSLGLIGGSTRRKSSRKQKKKKTIRKKVSKTRQRILKKSLRKKTRKVSLINKRI